MQGTTNAPEQTIGLDVGDRHSHLCVLDEAGEIVEEIPVPTRTPAVQARFGGMEPARVVLEVGPHSPWISRLLADAGHEVIVANRNPEEAPTNLRERPEMRPSGR